MGHRFTNYNVNHTSVKSPFNPEYNALKFNGEDAYLKLESLGAAVGTTDEAFTISCWVLNLNLSTEYTQSVTFFDSVFTRDDFPNYDRPSFSALS